MIAPDVLFPNLGGIRFENINSVAFTIFGLDIMWYGMIVFLGLALGVTTGVLMTKRNGITKDFMLDYLIIAIPVALICTRLYYVVFNWDIYRHNPVSIFAVRDGGMAVYGGILSTFVTVYLFSRYHARKSKAKGMGTTGEIMGKIADSGAPGLLVGQIVGRIGNLVNQEAFGGFTDGLFAMQLRLANISGVYRNWSLERVIAVPEANVLGHVTYEMLQNAFYYPGTTDVVVLVHPTFLYEMLLNAAIFTFLVLYNRYKKFYGELLLFYAILYSAGRFFIESLRTDQLTVGGTGIPASMLVSVVMFAVALSLWVVLRIRASKSKKAADVKSEDAKGETKNA